jgi:hypothetical protein
MSIVKGRSSSQCRFRLRFWTPHTDRRVLFFGERAEAEIGAL